MTAHIFHDGDVATAQLLNQVGHTEVFQGGDKGPELRHKLNEVFGLHLHEGDILTAKELNNAVRRLTK